MQKIEYTEEQDYMLRHSLLICFNAFIGFRAHGWMSEDKTLAKVADAIHNLPEKLRWIDGLPEWEAVVESVARELDSVDSHAFDFLKLVLRDPEGYHGFSEMKLFSPD